MQRLSSSKNKMQPSDDIRNYFLQTSLFLGGTSGTHCTSLEQGIMIPRNCFLALQFRSIRHCLFWRGIQAFSSYMIKLRLKFKEERSILHKIVWPAALRRTETIDHVPCIFEIKNKGYLKKCVCCCCLKFISYTFALSSLAQSCN